MAVSRRGLFGLLAVAPAATVGVAPAPSAKDAARLSNVAAGPGAHTVTTGTVVLPDAFKAALAEIRREAIAGARKSLIEETRRGGVRVIFS